MAVSIETQASSDDRFQHVLTPALVVDLDAVRHNVRCMVEHAGTADRWRPHLKTSKLPVVWEQLLREDLRCFKCATTREAACLLDLVQSRGLDGVDLLVAYPLAPPHLDRLAALAAAHPETRVSVLCEDPGNVPEGLGVFVDVNPGMNRTGIPADRLDEVRAVARAGGKRWRGVHFYEGHLHGRPAEERRRAAYACYDQLLAIVEALRADGLPPGEVITSGTPTALDALAHAGLASLPETGTAHRISPGTVVLHDARSEQECPELGLRAAATLLTRVVSHPAPDVVTCDAGSKSIAAEAGDPCAVVVGRPDLLALTPSEEHLPLRVTRGTLPPRGTLLQLVPHHVCPTVNLAEQAVLLDKGRLVGIADVAARAHEMLFPREIAVQET